MYIIERGAEEQKQSRGRGGEEEYTYIEKPRFFGGGMIVV